MCRVSSLASFEFRVSNFEFQARPDSSRVSSFAEIRGLDFDLVEIRDPGFDFVEIRDSRLSRCEIRVEIVEIRFPNLSRFEISSFDSVDI